MYKFEIRTVRLIISLVVKEDITNIHTLHAMPETDRYNTLGIPDNVQHTAEIIQPWIDGHSVLPIKNYTCKIEDHKGVFIGLISLNLGKEKYKNAEIWYKLRRDQWGKGYATEAASSLVAFGFKELSLHRIQAGCAVANTGSIRVLEKIGMIREGVKRQCLPLKDGWSDAIEFGILKSEA